ncbi:hypothetical protein [Paracidobacterium acidisoli]|uniref:Uncharacterized protein n=1 Tax=Paracidobacterium acidisoli TaxID=2303751 RepID=A0A372IQD8_9BACT|nr:hypothetical protein [Paracidobacterium acidisoli]MBT9331456.1 hypothetical protein [Paracidobacterium acidisoli]
MVSECINPACRQKLLYLRNGRVVRVTRQAHSVLQIEHFWLCGECFLRYDFHFLPGGEVEILPRAMPLSEEEPVVDLAFTA